MAKIAFVRLAYTGNLPMMDMARTCNHSASNHLHQA